MCGISSDDIGVGLLERGNGRRGLLSHGGESLHGERGAGGLGLAVSTGNGFSDREICLSGSGEARGLGEVDRALLSIAVRGGGKWIGEM